MEFEIPVGQEGVQELMVKYEDTAANYGSGLVEVYATPAMVALMEKTCLMSVLQYLPDGYGTVGTKVDIVHTKATPVGMRVVCRSRLVKIDRRKLVFEVEAEDEAGVIGRGHHERFIIDTDQFMAKTGAPAK
ncbi:thioesterase family protein [Desulfogranum japonicum]|uniref:thioesterase family protein n=1 Tax=Desulfogranum japonicum TaxID=231447 RepID=UPI00040C13C4|nr:thioesterase family protein [Desulfogranum japonicum]